MIQGNFHRCKGAKAVRSSGHHSDLVVETLGRTGGHLASGLEPVQYQSIMSPQHPRHLLHRFQPAAHRSLGPTIQKTSRPKWTAILPKNAGKPPQNPRLSPPPAPCLKAL